MINIIFNSRTFKEGESYVSVCPELNISSFGENMDDARVGLKQAVEVFVADCEVMGKLEEVLEEAGFDKVLEPSEIWMPREPLSEEKMVIGGWAIFNQ